MRMLWISGWFDRRQDVGAARKVVFAGPGEPRVGGADTLSEIATRLRVRVSYASKVLSRPTKVALVAWSIQSFRSINGPEPNTCARHPAASSVVASN